MNTLVTGVCSYVGRYLSEHLIAHGHGVVGFDIRKSDDVPSGVEFVEGDVRDFAAVNDAARACDTGVHLAVRAGDSSAEDIFGVNVSGAYGFMAAARGNQFRNSIVAGSAPVHLAADEADNGSLLRTLEGDHVYDLSKALQEVVARGFHARGTPAMCLRFGHIVWGEREVNLDEPTPLIDFDYCRGGWVALEDVVTACAMALEASPNRDTFEILNVVGARAARKRFNTGAVEQRLGFRFAYDFAGYD